MNTSKLMSAAALFGIAGLAVAAPTVNGVNAEADGYGQPLYVNTANPTSFGDNQLVASVGDPELVTKGIEIRIPLADIGYTSGAIRFSLMVNGGNHGFLSNQVLASLPGNTANLGNPAVVDFTTIAGNQFISITPANATTAPVIDGTREAAYGVNLAPGNARIQGNYTGFGDATHGNRSGRNGGPGNDGSEIDGFYVRRDATFLYVFIAGNLEDNGNKLELFIDSKAGGQNQLAGLPGDFANMNGMKFDAGFDADYLYSFFCYGTTGPAVTNVGIDAVDLATSTQTFLGLNRMTDAAAVEPSLYIEDVNLPGTYVVQPGGTRLAIDNSNIAGVVGQTVGGSADNSTGSEIDAVYAKVENNRLFVMVTGNLQSSFNKLELFFDVRSGGQSRLRGASNLLNNYNGNPAIDFNCLRRMGSSDAAMADVFAGITTEAIDGLKFDDGFTADYYMNLTTGGSPIQVYTNVAFLRTNGLRLDPLTFASQDYTGWEGGNKVDYNPINFTGRSTPIATSPTGDGELFSSFGPRTLTAGLPDTATPPYSPDNPFNTPPVSLTGTPGLIESAINNSNTAGITAAAASEALALAVTTGMEFSIDLAELGWDGTSNIKICGFINGSDHGFASNQVFGGLPAAAASLGEIRNVNFAAIEGNQYVEIVINPPAPACLADVVADGSVDGSDFIAFINSFAIGDASVDPAADVAGGGDPNLPEGGPDGTIDGTDFIAFINAFAAGC